MILMMILSIFALKCAAGYFLREDTVMKSTVFSWLPMQTKENTVFAAAPASQNRTYGAATVPFRSVVPKSA